MQVNLTVEEYEFFLKYVPRGSPAYKCLELVVKLYGLHRNLPDEFGIELDIETTEVLLIFARTNCPSAADKLEAAFRELLSRGRKG